MPLRAEAEEVRREPAGPGEEGQPVVAAVRHAVQVEHGRTAPPGASAPARQKTGLSVQCRGVLDELVGHAARHDTGRSAGAGRSARSARARRGRRRPRRATVRPCEPRPRPGAVRPPPPARAACARCASGCASSTASRVMAPHGDPLAELVLTVLSQSTNDRNRDVAFLRLRERFPPGRRCATRRSTRSRRRSGPAGSRRSSRAASRRSCEALAGDLDLVVDARRAGRRGARRAVRAARRRAARRRPACCCSPTARRDVPVDTHVSPRRRRGWRLLRPGAPFDEQHDAMLRADAARRRARAARQPAAPRPPHVPRAAPGAARACALRRMCPSRRLSVISGRRARVPEAGRPRPTSSSTGRSRAAARGGRAARARRTSPAWRAPDGAVSRWFYAEVGGQLHVGRPCGPQRRRVAGVRPSASRPGWPTVAGRRAG